MHRDNKCMYMARVHFVSVIVIVRGVCENVCCVAAGVKDSVLALACWTDCGDITSGLPTSMSLIITGYAVCNPDITKSTEIGDVSPRAFFRKP